MRDDRCGWINGRAPAAAVVLCALGAGLTRPAQIYADGIGEYTRNSLTNTLRQDALNEVAATIPPAFGTKGSWRWVLYGGSAIDLRRDGETYHVVLAASDFLADDFSLDFELGGLFLNQQNKLPGAHDGVGANANVLFRWHFLSRDTWSLYADAGAGLLLATEEVPYGGTTFNLTPQAGTGVSLALGGGPERLMTGIRWFHISNARVRGQDNNPGRDSVYFYVGVSFPF